jgi:bifunctional non-homologous end joining protein LigD
MLATLTHDRFDDKDWIYERKFDGERCMTYRSGSAIHLMSRNEKELRGQYPEIAEAFLGQTEDDFIVDGEIVAFSGDVTSFERLQGRMHVEAKDPLKTTGIRVYYYLFDVVYLNGYSLEKLPLRARKRLLRRAFDYKDPLRFAIHRNEKGTAFFDHACRKGWEGLIAKDARSEYVHARSRSWLKFKCVADQELVICGFTEPQGSRIGFGALLLGYYDGKDLVYAGKVGTGFDDQTLEHLHEQLKEIERPTSPFDRNEAREQDVHYVKPMLVAEIGFTEWTREGRLRHPRYLGLRDDKDAGEVVREDPEAGSS